MTVAELIEILKEMPQDVPAFSEGYRLTEVTEVVLEDEGVDEPYVCIL
jgi:hypothetical protein